MRKFDARTGNPARWEQEFEDDTNAAAITKDASGVYVTGATGLIATWHAFVRKYDPNGKELWPRPPKSDTTFDIGLAITVDASGVYMAGGTRGTGVYEWDCLVRKYDANGTQLWEKQFGMPGKVEELHAIAAEASEIYVAGPTADWSSVNGKPKTIKDSSDVLLLKYASSGDLLGMWQFGTSGDDDDARVAVNDHGIYVAGRTTGTFQKSKSAGGIDAYVVRFGDLPCISSISPTEKSFSASGGRGSVQVDAQAGCKWSAVSNVNWIHLTSGSDFEGSRTLEYSVDANMTMTTTSRTGTLAVPGKTLSVMQPTFLVSPVIRIAALLLFSLPSLALLVLLTRKYGEGNNFMQMLKNFWLFYSLWATALAALGRLLRVW